MGCGRVRRLCPVGMVQGALCMGDLWSEGQPPWRELRARAGQWCARGPGITDGSPDVHVTAYKPCDLGESLHWLDLSCLIWKMGVFLVVASERRMVSMRIK